MAKVVRLTESDITRLVRRVIEEQSSEDDKAKFIVMMESFPKFKFNPNHPMKEFAFVPKKGDVGFSGFGNKEFDKFLGKPLIFSLDDTTYCYLDNRNNFVIKHLGKKTTVPLVGNINKIKSILSEM